MDTSSDTMRVGSCAECATPLDPLLAPVTGLAGGRVVPFCSATCRERWGKSDRVVWQGGAKICEHSLPAVAPRVQSVLGRRATLQPAHEPADRVEPVVAVAEVSQPTTFEPVAGRRVRRVLLAASLMLTGTAGCLVALWLQDRSQSTPVDRAALANAKKRRASRDQATGMKGVAGGMNPAKVTPAARSRRASARGGPAGGNQAKGAGGAQAAPATLVAIRSSSDAAAQRMPEAGSAERRRFRFAIISDTHVGDRSAETSPATRQAVRTIIEGVRPTFVLHTGDMIDIRAKMGIYRTLRIRKMWLHFKRRVTRPLTAAGIGFFPTPGNHDVDSAWSLYQRQWAYHRNPGFTVSGPSRYMGYYSFDHGNAHFISITATGTTWLLDRPRQLAWLTKDLRWAKERGKRHVFVFSHSPLMCPAMQVRCATGRVWLQDVTLWTLLKKYGAVHFGGHMHVFHDRTFRGVRSITVGGLARQMRRMLARATRQRPQFLVVDVQGDEVRYYRVKAPEMSTAHLPPPPPAAAVEPKPALGGASKAPTAGR